MKWTRSNDIICFSELEGDGLQLVGRTPYRDAKRIVDRHNHAIAALKEAHRIEVAKLQERIVQLRRFV